MIETNQVTGQCKITVGDQTHQFRFGLAAGIRFDQIRGTQQIGYVEEAGYYLMAGQVDSKKSFDECIELLEALPAEDIATLSNFATHCYDFFYQTPNLLIHKHRQEREEKIKNQMASTGSLDTASV